MKLKKDEINYIPYQHGKSHEITQTEANKLFAAGLEDTSWGNDICASFTLLQKHQCLRLWIEAKKFEDRESESKYRFVVSQYNADMDDYIGDLIETDSLDEALSCIQANQEDDDEENDTDVGICKQCGEQGQIRTTCRHCGRGIIEAINEG
ncbi:MAG: hypothetical protein ACPHZD_06710 [Porticoccaceae bacterium]